MKTVQPPTTRIYYTLHGVYGNFNGLGRRRFHVFKYKICIQYVKKEKGETLYSIRNSKCIIKLKCTSCILQTPIYFGMYLFIFSFRHNEFCFNIMECLYAACIAVACVCRCLYALNAVILSTAAQ